MEISVYNILGHRVSTLVRSDHSPGHYSVIWNGRDDAGRGVAAGVYLHVLRATGSVQRGKMLLLDGSDGAPAGVPLPGGSR